MDYKRKIAQCEKLGANKFQDIVFKTEELKFKVIKKTCPNFIKHYDKFCNWQRDMRLKKVTDESERKKIIDHYKKQKLLTRKEFVQEKNRNYHMDPNNPTEFIQYLEWNKNVHKNGLIKNAVLIPALTITSICGIIPAIPLLGIELISLFINFQCVNIQNYNIYRFKDKEEILRKLETSRQNQNIKKYGEAAKVISESMEKADDIPSMDDIINSITTKEQLEQLRNMILANQKLNKTIQKKEKYTQGRK